MAFFSLTLQKILLKSNTNMNQNHKFVFFGTPKVASDTLATLVEHDFIPAVVVTAPDAPRGRGLVLTPSEAKTLALAHSIPVLTPDALDNETISAIRAYECDYAVVVAYGKIFPSELIEIFPKGMLNVHYSLLPKHRGAIPVEAALLAGDSETGVTIQTIVREVDAGDVLAQEKTKIAPDETARELRARLIPMGAQLLVAMLPKYLNGEITPIVQDASLASKEWRLNKEDGLLSLDAPAEENWKKYRAYADGIGTYFFENDKRMKITKASFKNNKFVIERVIPEGKNDVVYTAS
jgi:methionyl-tRNA formyltransferase